MRRPLGFVALLYAAGLLLGELLTPPLALLFGTSLTLAVAALALKKCRWLLLGPLIVLTGWTNLAFRTAVISPRDLRARLKADAELVTVRGKLIDTPGERAAVRDDRESVRSQARLEVVAFARGTNWQPAFGRIAVVTSGALPENYFAGGEVEVFGVIAPPPGPIAEGLFDYRTWLRRQGIFYQLTAESSNDWRALKIAGAAPVDQRFRAWARRSLALGLPAEDESLRLEYALTLGDKSVLTDEVSEPFVRAATYHIFAVDGLRMAIIFGIFFALFRALRLPRVGGGLLLIPVIWFYVALTGWPASAIRAAVMLTIVIAGWALRRPGDLLNSLFAAALVILVWEPQQLFQAGFQLSFFVVLCILLMLPAFDKLSERLLQGDPFLPEQLRPRWRRMLDAPLRFFLDLLMTSLAAWLGSIPLVAYYFNIVTPVSAPANVLAVPLCALVLISNLISLLLAGWFPGGAALFNHAGWFLMECIRVSSEWFAQSPFAWRYAAAPDWFGTGLYYAALIAMATGWLFQPRRRAWKIGALTSLALVWMACWLAGQSATRLTILPLNGGSAIYFDAPGSRNDLLIDCGNETSAGFITKPFLRAQGVNSLSCLALTHGDVRRVGGAELICREFSVKQIAVGPAPFRSAVYRNFVESLDATPERRRVSCRGGQLGGWTILHPDPEDRFPQADDNALVLRGEFGGTRVLLLSDLGRPGQEALLRRDADVRADIVVSGLPAQGEPLCDALLDAIHPKLMVITDSEFPVAHRAGAALRERLEARGVPVIYTRHAGAVTFLFNGTEWNANAMNGFKLSGVATHEQRIARMP